MRHSESRGRRTIRWRHWNRSLHRDVGYFVLGLTVIYAVSGVAVNHTRDWNPNYRFFRQVETFAPIVPGDRAATVAAVVDALELPPPVDAFRHRPDQVTLFYEGWSVEADLSAGRAVIERPRRRPVLYAFNRLHLNRDRGLWTWVADLYALLLLFMPLSGLFILRGKNGFAGRGKWLVSLGIVLPLGYWLLR